jgi:hypothetical protein
MVSSTGLNRQCLGRTILIKRKTRGCLSWHSAGSRPCSHIGSRQVDPLWVRAADEIGQAKRGKELNRK